ncbi:MAG TPA: 16S rRNA (guanine(527)-N(7))-methyltransferase RsmG [Candidatus Avidesulfovibrio excrementigallinarum]|nr:16S rRNA (guanine(527)-N(7))-methyltransferase RsmG [Candidatus Avidesulfovibrio excrementigallinarum]
MTTQELSAEIAAMGLTVPAEALPPLQAYLEMLTRWNRVMNLVGASTWQRALRTLVVDSIHLAAFVQQPQLALPAAPRCWDLGAGAGLPGLPLRMLWQNGTYWLVEAREKRALFMRTVLANNPLPGTQVHWGRAETFMPGAGQADLILSRAFMPWEKLLDFVAPHLAPAGTVVLLLNEPVSLPQNSPWIERARLLYHAGNATRCFVALTCNR